MRTTLGGNGAVCSILPGLSFGGSCDFCVLLCRVVLVTLRGSSGALVDGEEVGVSTDEDGDSCVGSTVFDEFSTVDSGPEAGCENATSLAQGIESGWELNVGNGIASGGGVLLTMLSVANSAPLPSPTSIANGPAIKAHLPMVRLSVGDRKAVFFAR